MRNAIKTLAEAMAEKAQPPEQKKPIGAKRKAILKSQIEVACRGAQEFIADLAALVKDRDCPSLPVDNIKMTLQRGEHVVDAALRLLSERE